MFAVVKIGSEQFKVSEGDLIEVNRLPEDAGKEIQLDVLAYENGTDVRFGQPYLKDVKVAAAVKENTRGERVIAFKFRKRTNWKKIHGHRADLTALNIIKIQG
ncbi:MAG: 50S ribosomal protein L21 [Candidatus Omnitrophica bacterium]|nr:50S ribosomal protein L21 [Candidatus Omnitrophota bacterium]